MLPLSSRIAFLVYALAASGWGAWAFYRMYRRIRRGRADTEARWDRWPERVGSALVTTLTQERTFKKRRVVALFHSFIFYGFALYGLVNLVDAAEGYFPLDTRPTTPLMKGYSFAADVFSFLVLVGVVALVFRRFLLPGRRDFRFNARTLLHEKVQEGRITRDSVIVSAFILFHVGSRAVGSAAAVVIHGQTRWEPFASVLAQGISPEYAGTLRLLGYWGALGSVLAFLAYFPYSKHVHLFMAPLKYGVGRRAGSGVMPPVEVSGDAVESGAVGAGRLEDLAWPRLLDAYACIQCNRCQDVCPASATGKSLSPAALEINKRMELNELGAGFGLSKFERGSGTPRPLLQFALSPEAAWACTTCGACVEVCPVGDEQMLDILDIRRHQVMIEGEFPQQLQTAFRGMERAQNPWGISRAKRMDWAEGLKVRTTEENPAPEVLYWVGCAASYDPSAQKTARAFVQLLDHAGVDYAVLGKRECCTGDSARRAGNEVLYRQLADENVGTLNAVRPKLIVASCPHCMNAIGKEYGQIGGDFRVVHHTEYLEGLVAAGKISSASSDARVTYHDPCYLGRHNGVYDAPRNLLKVLSNDVVELGRTRENSFCCGAGGAQFWKEEEAGEERISDNRFREAQGVLSGAEEKVLAVGCPFCKSMLASTPLKGEAEDVVIKDVAELLWEGVLRGRGDAVEAGGFAGAVVEEGVASLETSPDLPPKTEVFAEEVPGRGAASVGAERHQQDTGSGRMEVLAEGSEPAVADAVPGRKKWVPKVEAAAGFAELEAQREEAKALVSKAELVNVAPVVRAKWQPKSVKPAVSEEGQIAAGEPPVEGEQVSVPEPRKKWVPKK